LKLHLPYILGALDRVSFNGELSLMEGGIERTIFFKAGSPVNIRSGLQEETLGRILLEEGRISNDEYTVLLDEMVKTRQRAGDILVGMGILGPQDVFLALEFQNRRKILNCFKMVDFGFSINSRPIEVEQQISRLNISEILFAGIQEAYSVDRLLNEFPVDEESVFKTVEHEQKKPIKMGPRENKIYRSIGTGSTMSSLMSIVDDLQILLSALYGLHGLYLIEASGVDWPDIDDLELEGLKEVLPPSTRIARQKLMAGETKPIPVQAVEEAVLPKSLAETIAKDGVDGNLARKVLSLSKVDYFSLLEIHPMAKGSELKTAFFKKIREYQLQDVESSYKTEADRENAKKLLDQFTIAYRELDDEKNRKEYIEALKNNAVANREVPKRIIADVEAQKGKLALGAKRYQEAVSFFEVAIQLYPEDPSYYFNLGVAKYELAISETDPGESLPEAVKKPFKKALDMNPRYDQASLYLGYIAKRNGQLKQALNEFHRAAESNPHNKRALSEIRLLKKRLKGK
jgi:hypothetical protein